MSLQLDHHYMTSFGADDTMTETEVRKLL